jgi:hypothetical protein
MRVVSGALKWLAARVDRLDDRGKAWRGYLFWGAVSVGVAVIVVALNLGAPQTWNSLGVPAIMPRWVDSRILVQAAKCRARGIDPLLPNRCNAGNPLLYPTIWLTIADFLGRSAGLLALLGTGTFLGGLTLAFARVRPGLISASTFLLGTLGPPAMLALERGNVELIVIGMVAAAGVLLSKKGLLAFIVGTALMIVPALLKIYSAPLFLVPIVVALRFPARGGLRTKRLAIAGLMSLAAGLALLASSDIGRINRLYQEPSTYAFGARTFIDFIHSSGWRVLWDAGAAYYVAVFALLAFIIWWSVRPSRRITVPSFSRGLRHLTSTPEGILLLSGILLFATILYFANYPYRLLALSLTLPACTKVLQREDPGEPACRPVRSALALVTCTVALGGLTTLEPHIAGGVAQFTLTGQALGVATDLTMVGSVLALWFAVLLAVGMAASDTDAAPDLGARTAGMKGHDGADR